MIHKFIPNPHIPISCKICGEEERFHKKLCHCSPKECRHPANLLPGFKCKVVAECPGCMVTETLNSELHELLKNLYSVTDGRKLGTIKCINYDPAGSDYEFTEFEWSKRIREILGITYEPTGI